MKDLQWDLVIQYFSILLLCVVALTVLTRGQKDFIMTANFGLPSVGAENRDAYMKAISYFQSVIFQKA